MRRRQNLEGYGHELSIEGNKRVEARCGKRELGMEIGDIKRENVGIESE